MILEEDEPPELPDGWRWCRLERWFAHEVNYPIEVEVSDEGVEIGHEMGYLPIPVPFTVIKAVADANGVEL